MNADAIVVAAGSGTRAGTDVPKQFLRLGGQTLVERCVERLGRCAAVRRIVVVLPPRWRESGWPAPTPSERVALVPGGARRQDSVAAGLAATSAELVLVHDAARPFVSTELVERLLRAAARHGAAAPALPVPDTVKQVAPGGAVVRTVDRARLALVQTPQVFRADWLRRAHELSALRGTAGTDDAALVEAIGHPVHTVPGDRLNFKVTDPFDLRLAELLQEA